MPEPSAKEDLRTLVAGYLSSVTVPLGTAAAGSTGGTASKLGPGGAGAVDACVELYLAAKAEAVRRFFV